MVFFFSETITTTQQGYNCNQCSKTYKRLNYLERHRQLTGHRINVYSEPPSLSQQLMIFECPDCSKKFTRKDVLNRHRGTHLGLRPFECTHCGRKFGRKHHLVRHIKTHTGEKNYQCDQCEKRFARNESLREHIQVKHQAINYSPYNNQDDGLLRFPTATSSTIFQVLQSAFH